MLFRYRLGDEVRQAVVTAIRRLGPGGEGGMYALDLEDGTKVQTHGSDLDAHYPEWRSYLKEADMGWKEVRQSGDMVKWDEPRTIEGFYNGSEERETDFGVNQIHFVETQSGRVAFFGTVLLTQALKEIEKGQLIRVTYTGKQTKTPKGKMKEFIVEVHEPDEAEAKAPVAVGAEAAAPA